MLPYLQILRGGEVVSSRAHNPESRRFESCPRYNSLLDVVRCYFEL